MAAVLHVSGFDGLEHITSDMLARMADLGPILRIAGEDITALVDDSFENSRAPTGRPWKPLAESTAKRRRRNSSKPLVDTGQLRNSVHARAEAQHLTFGSNVPYAGFQQFGTERIPARPFLPIKPSGEGFDLISEGPAGEELRRIKAEIRDYILNGL